MRNGRQAKIRRQKGALERLSAVKAPSEREKKEILILTEKLKGL